MKKIISVLSCVLALTVVSSCDWFELDNQEGWDASVEGQILDAGTNQTVQFEQGSSTIAVKEKYGSADANQYWYVKSNGTFKNNLVFAGDYTMNTLSSNFVAEEQAFKLAKGSNTVNFKVTPYVRIENVTWAMEGKKIKATCKVSSPVSGVNNIGEVRLCISVDRFVSYSNNGAKGDDGAYVTDMAPDGTSGTITLVIDPDKLNANGVKVNAQEFQYDQVHYVRVAALGAHYAIVPEWEEEVTTDEFDMDAYTAAGFPSDWWNYFKKIKVTHPASYTNDGTVNSGNAYNYSPVYKVDLKAGTFTEVTDW